MKNRRSQSMFSAAPPERMNFPSKGKPSRATERAAGLFLESKRGRPAIRCAPPAGRAAGRILKPLAKRFGPGVEQLKAYWEKIVGPRLAKWSEPEAIRKNAGIVTLVIRARGPAGTVIQAETKKILERVRLYTGAKGPTRLKIMQGITQATKPQTPIIATTSDSSQVSEGVEPNTDDRLLSALNRFQRSVKSRDGL